MSSRRTAGGGALAAGAVSAFGGLVAAGADGPDGWGGAGFFGPGLLASSSLLDGAGALLPSCDGFFFSVASFR